MIMSTKIKSEEQADQANKPVTFEDWGAYYNNEEKVDIVIQVDQLNPTDMVVPVCLHGYIYQVKRGEHVMVPKTVASVLKGAGYKVY
jgi:hypothetical protein